MSLLLVHGGSFGLIFKGANRLFLNREEKHKLLTIAINMFRHPAPPDQGACLLLGKMEWAFVRQIWSRYFEFIDVVLLEKPCGQQILKR